MAEQVEYNGILHDFVKNKEKVQAKENRKRSKEREYAEQRYLYNEFVRLCSNSFENKYCMENGVYFCSNCKAEIRGIDDCGMLFEQWENK
jgi:hypothetical protein